MRQAHRLSIAQSTKLTPMPLAVCPTLAKTRNLRAPGLRMSNTLRQKVARLKSFQPEEF